MKHLKNMDIIFLIVLNFLKKKIGVGRKIERINSPVLDKKISPPGTDSPIFNSFASAKRNKFGLQLDIFKEKEAGVACIWRAEKKFEGYPNALHGGIGFTILDEALAYAVFEKYNTFAVTLSSKLFFLNSIKTNRDLFVKAEVVFRFLRFVKVRGCIADHKGRVSVKSVSVFYIPTKKQFYRLADKNLFPKESLPYFGID